jgi:hypothetical protein
MGCSRIHGELLKLGFAVSEHTGSAMYVAGLLPSRDGNSGGLSYAITVRSPRPWTSSLCRHSACESVLFLRHRNCIIQKPVGRALRPQGFSHVVEAIEPCWLPGHRLATKRAGSCMVISTVMFLSADTESVLSPTYTVFAATSAPKNERGSIPAFPASSKKEWINISWRHHGDPQKARRG